MRASFLEYHLFLFCPVSLWFALVLKEHASSLSKAFMSWTQYSIRRTGSTKWLEKVVCPLLFKFLDVHHSCWLRYHLKAVSSYPPHSAPCCCELKQKRDPPHTWFCTLAVTPALNRNRITQLFLQTVNATPILKPQAQIVTESLCVRPLIIEKTRSVNLRSVFMTPWKWL